MPFTGNGDEVEHGEVSEVWFTRPYRTMWNPFGEPHEVPTDQANLIDLLLQGWTMIAPEHPRERPQGKLMRNGSIFYYEDSAKEVSDVERRRMERDPSTVMAQTQAPAPTATYYSPQGDKLEGLPADPESMAKYLELGLSLTPPAKTPARRRLKAV